MLLVAFGPNDIVHELLNDERISFLTASHGKNLSCQCVNQMFLLVLLWVNEAKSWGTSIYNYAKACQCVLLLIALPWSCACTGNTIDDVVRPVWVPPPSFLYTIGNPAVGYVVAIIMIEVQAL